MSVIVEKRRKVAELENFERKVLQEKRRLMRELESLERPFRKARATDWIKDFSSDLVGEWRAMQDSASSRAPLWFFVVGAIILLGGGGLVAHMALKRAPQQPHDATALRRVENPLTQPATPAPETQAAQIAEVAPLATAPAEAARDSVASPAQPPPDATALRERLLEAQSAPGPLPEPLPPPMQKAEAPASPPPDAATVSPLDEAPPKTAVDDAPPVDTAAPAESESAAPVREVERQQHPADEGRRTQCLVKVDGRVLFEKTCLLRQAGRSSLTLTAGKDSLVLTLDHGRTWTATLGGENLGPVYRTGQCWGRRRQVYICAKGA